MKHLRNPDSLLEAAEILREHADKLEDDTKQTGNQTAIRKIQPTLRRVRGLAREMKANADRIDARRPTEVDD